MATLDPQGGWGSVKRRGAHAVVVQYARFALAQHIEQADLDRLDLLRRTRHLAEYAGSATTISEPDASAAIQLAQRVLAGVKKAMTSPRDTS